jgi:hypothetical protein
VSLKHQTRGEKRNVLITHGGAASRNPISRESSILPFDEVTKATSITYT